MFKNPIERGRAVLLRNSDKRKLHERVVKTFGASASPVFDPKNDDIQETHTKARHVLYVSSGEPLFFTDAANALLPTVYALWRVPKLVRRVLIPANVAPFIFKGANLMLPGVIGGLDPADSAWKQDDVCSVVVRGNRNPIAVGRIACDREQAKARQGVAVTILHLYKDYLWGFGSKKLLPEEPDSEEEDEEDEEEEEETEVAEEVTEQVEEEAKEEVVEKPVEEPVVETKEHVEMSMDDLLRESLLRAVRIRGEAE